MKKNFFGIIFNFNGFAQLTYQKKFLFKKISENFDQFYLINSSNIEFFGGKKEFNLEELKKKIPHNFVLINPKNSKEFNNFFKDKFFILIASIGRQFGHFKIHYLLNKKNIKLIFLNNIGNFQGTEYHKISVFFKLQIFKKIPHKIVILLSILNIFPKIDLRFISNKKNYEKATNNFFYKFSKNFSLISLFYTKNFFLVNSMSYDESKSKNLKVTEDKIVMVDTNINHVDNIKYSGYINEQTIKKCYEKLETFLKKLSFYYDKPVIVCLHPTSKIEKISEYLKDFEVVKYKTRENIYKSFITLFYESSSIVDAYILNKRIIALENSMMGGGWLRQVEQYPKKTGILKINILKEFDIENKKTFLDKLNSTISMDKYQNYLKNNLKPDGENIGTEKIIRILKDKYKI